MTELSHTENRYYMDFEKMWTQLTEDETIQVHIEDINSYTKDYRLLSTLGEIESEARFAIGFDRAKIFLPLMACYAILDQIGICYMNLDLPPYPDSNASGIKKAAYYFLGYKANDDLTKTLYALRNGIMHNASFVCDSRGGEHYWFRFDDKITTMVQLANKAWDGNQQSQSDDNCSLINPKLFVDSVSMMLRQLRELHKNNKLKTVIPGGASELAKNYIHRIPR